MEIFKTYNVKQPTAGTTVHTSSGPAQGSIAPPAGKADFFFRNKPAHTAGSGNLMVGNPRAKPRKKRD